LCGAWERSPAIFRGPGTAFPRVLPYFNHCVYCTSRIIFSLSLYLSLSLSLSLCLSRIGMIGSLFKRLLVSIQASGREASVADGDPGGHGGAPRDARGKFPASHRIAARSLSTSPPPRRCVYASSGSISVAVYHFSASLR